jgi:hypothetical protein
MSRSLSDLEVAAIIERCASRDCRILLHFQAAEAVPLGPCVCLAPVRVDSVGLELLSWLCHQTPVISMQHGALSGPGHGYLYTSVGTLKMLSHDENKHIPNAARRHPNIQAISCP